MAGLARESWRIGATSFVNVTSALCAAADAGGTADKVDIVSRASPTTPREPNKVILTLAIIGTPPLNTA
jgi:hypothetical protein